MSKPKSKDNNRKSLCEESMLAFVNILKLSSLSLARTTLLKTPPNNNNQTSSPTQKTEIEKTGYHTPNKQHRSKRSQKPEQAKSSKYVILPENDISTTLSPKYREIANVDGHFSDYIRRFHEKTENDHENAIVEGKVESFIKRFHEKNIVDLNNESMRRNYVLPPPPRYTFK